MPVSGSSDSVNSMFTYMQPFLLHKIYEMPTIKLFIRLSIKKNMVGGIDQKITRAPAPLLLTIYKFMKLTGNFSEKVAKYLQKI